MSHLRRPKSAESPTKRNRQTSQLDNPTKIGMGMGLLLIFLFISIITCAESFVVKDWNRYSHSRGIGNNDYHHQQQQEHYTAPMRNSHHRSALSKRLLSLSSSSSSDDSENDCATANATFSNSTSGAGNASTMEERKRYNDELEEAFAKQTRERNPLLGVKSIGVDYGLVRTGVAVTIGYSPQALDVIVTDHPLLREDEAEGMLEEDVEKEEERRLEIQRAKVAKRVVELASREKADRIVVGLPLHKNGTEAPQSLLARKFARDHLAIAALRTLGPGVSVFMCDERYTSKEAAARIRSSQPSGNNNNQDLYGLLDAESAKIILEQHYDDHVDRRNTVNPRNIDGETNSVDSSYNGELVTIADADLVEELTQEYNEKRRLEQEQLAAERNDREARAKWRKLEMEKDRIRAKEQQEKDAANGIVTKKKKKKKKRKRK